MVTCRKCNSESNENDSICTKCGAALYDFDDNDFDYKIEETSHFIINPKSFFYLFIFVSIMVLAMIVCICIALW